MAYLAREEPMKRHIVAGICLAAGWVLAGCSTVQGDWSQKISIEAVDAQNRPVDGLACEVGEGSSAQSVTTPARDVRVRRSAMSLQVSCGSGGQLASATVKPRRERMEEALLPFGSVGVFVDHLSGALYAYPTVLRLHVGQHVVLEHGGESQVTSAEPLPAAPATAAHTELASVATYPTPRRPVSPTPVLATARPRSAATVAPLASASHPARPIAIAAPVRPVAPAQKIALSTSSIAVTTSGAAALASAPAVHTAPVNW
jgi:hypothetical protein